jgi:fumarylacetoacetate (FAA) hydrolase
MRLAAIAGGGELVVVSDGAYRTLDVREGMSLDHLVGLWSSVRGDLDEGKSLRESPNQKPTLGPPFRRTSQALYGSAFGNRSARVAQSHETVADALLVYQGSSDCFLGTDEPFRRIARVDAELDFEVELFVLIDSTQQGCTPDDALGRIRFVGGCNDFTYRDLIRRERISGFGFVQGKPLSSLAPMVIEPQDLGSFWNSGRPVVTAEVRLNNEVVGRVPSTGMQYSFQEIVAHAAATRPLSAGTLVSSGTLSAGGGTYGFCSLVEKRNWQMSHGVALTPYLTAGDSIQIVWSTAIEENVFGALRNVISFGE